MNLEYRRRDFDAQQTLDYRNQTSDELTLGFDGQVSPRFRSGIRAGWRQTKPDVQPGDPHVDNYSEPLVTGNLSYQVTQGSTLDLELLYTDYPSAFGRNAFYTATGGSLTYSLERERLLGQVRIRLQNNDYNEPDLVSGMRSDDIETFGLGLSYRFTNLISLTGGYLYEDRNSLHDYSYTANTFILGLVVGYGY